MKIPAVTCNNAGCKIKDTCLRFTYAEKASQNATLPISYTHLDVYKRQIINNGKGYKF